MRVEIIKLDKKEDERGWLVEVLKNDFLKNKEFGQFFITTAHSGFVKGNHYHTRKTEFFCVIKGEAKLLLTGNNTGEEKEILMGESNLVTVKINPGITHAIKNIGNDMMFLLSYIDEQYNEKDPDTFFKKIM